MVEHVEDRNRSGFIGLDGPRNRYSKWITLRESTIYPFVATTSAGYSGPHSTLLADDAATRLGCGNADYAQDSRLLDAPGICVGECAYFHRVGILPGPIDGSFRFHAVESGRGFLWHTMAELHWMVACLSGNHLWHLTQALARWIARSGICPDLVGGLHHVTHFLGFTNTSPGWVLPDGINVVMGGLHFPMKL